MSGDNQREDDPDFLDDEFVVEGLADAEPQDDLDQFFALPPQAEAAPKPPDDEAAAAEELFTDHTAEIEPTQSFGAEQPPFAEDAPSNWNGNELELDDPSTTPAAFAPPTVAESTEPMEFALDGAGEPWQAEAAAAAPGDFLGIADQPAEDAEAAYATEGDEPVADEAAYAEDAPADDAAYETVPAEEHAAVADGAEAPVYEFAPPRGNRFAVVLSSIAATLALVAGAGVVVMRPQWLGIAAGDKTFVVAKVERPHVDVELPAPPVVAATPAEPTPAPTVPTVVAAQPAPSQPVAEAQPVAPPPPVAVTQPVEPTPAPVAVPAPVETPVAVAPAPTVPPTPVATAPTTTPVAAAPSPVAAWPKVGKPESQAVARARKQPGTLVRVGEDTMLGDADASAAERRAVDGVIPGVRAFAQLRNGNFFIGAVKSVDDERVTLRTSEGEVTLGKGELARLTGLGTADFEALQKATDGFVRLTNSNKLVGGILSQIADDHVVLEFRSNRVILPRSAVGEVVAGQTDQGVRLGVTSEEDDWVRAIAEREIGKPKEPTKPKPASGK